MNFATLAKFHQKAFGSGSPLSFAGSHSAASSPMTLNFGDLEMDDSASTASASPEFTRRELESDSESDRSSSGLRTPEGSPPSSRTLSQAGQGNCKAKQPQAVLVHGQWSPDSTSDEGSSIGDEDQESPFSLSLPTESPLQAVRPPGLPLPAHFSTPIKAHSAPGFKKSSPKGIPLSHTTSSMPKSRVKQAAVAGPRSAPSAREAEESRRGRSRWVRLSFFPTFNVIDPARRWAVLRTPTVRGRSPRPRAVYATVRLRARSRSTAFTQGLTPHSLLSCLAASPTLAFRDRHRLTRRPPAVPHSCCWPAFAQARGDKHFCCGGALVAQDGARGALDLGLAHPSRWRRAVFTPSTLDDARLVSRSLPFRILAIACTFGLGGFARVLGRRGGGKGVSCVA